MQIMFDKNILKRTRDKRSHIYEAVYRKEDTQKLLMDKLLDSAFGGSAAKLVMHALGNSDTSKEELDEIKKLLDDIERKK